MAGRMGGHPHREAADGPGQLDQLGGVAELAPDGVGVGGGIAPQGQKVLDPGPAEGHQDLGQLQSAVFDADEVGHGREGRRPEHAGHQVVGPLARLPAAPVGDRDERRGQRLQLPQGPDEGGLLGVVLGREELEGVGGAPCQQVRDPGHGPDQPTGGREPRPLGPGPGRRPGRSCAAAWPGSWGRRRRCGG